MPGIGDKIGAVMTGFHARMYKATGGKFGSAIKGVPVITITTTGRKSGKPRTRPVVKLDIEAATYVIASKSGADEHPAWFLNLQANPSVHVVDGSQEYEATAVVLVGDERDAIYEAAKGHMDNFIRYEQKADRTIPVVRLDRA